MASSPCAAVAASGRGRSSSGSDFSVAARATSAPFVVTPSWHHTTVPRIVLSVLCALWLTTAAVAGAGCGDDSAAAPRLGPGEATIERVVDGDTLVVRVGGESE